MWCELQVEEDIAVGKRSPLVSNLCRGMMILYIDEENYALYSLECACVFLWVAGETWH